MIILNKSTKNRVNLLFSLYKRMIVLVTISLVFLLVLVSRHFYRNVLSPIEDNQNERDLEYYIATEIAEENIKYSKDPQMLQLLGIYDSKNIIPAMEKAPLYDENDNRFFDLNWTENFKITEYDYPLKLPSILYSNKEDINTKNINYQNCIMLLLSEASSILKSIRTIQSIVDNLPNMRQYPIYLITGFYLADHELVKVFNHFEDTNMEINIIKITDIIVDAKMCGESINYLFSGISDFKESEIIENNKIRFNNDFEIFYPENLYQYNKENDKLYNQGIKNRGHLIRILEEYGSASIDFNRLQSFDVFQFEYFKQFDNFMTIKPGMIFTQKNDIDLFENMNDGKDNVLVKFNNFRYSQRFRNANHYEVLQKVYKDLKVLIDPIFSNNDHDSIWKQLVTYGMKNLARYNKVKTRIFNVVNTMSKSELGRKVSFSGILFDTQDTIFISKFKLFRSLEYDLFFKTLLLMSSANDDSMIPNDPITLFLGLINRKAGDDSNYYREDFEMISDINLAFDSTGNFVFDNIDHWNTKSVREYMKRPNLGFDFDIEMLMDQETLLSSKREETREINKDVIAKLKKKRTDPEQESVKEGRTQDKEETTDKEIKLNEEDKPTHFHVDQRFFMKYINQDTLYFYKNHEIYQFAKEQFGKSFSDSLNAEEVEELMDLFIYDNVIKVKNMFEK